MDYIEKMSEEYLKAWLNTDRAADAIYELIRRQLIKQNEIICIIGAILLIIGISIIWNQRKIKKQLRQMIEEQKKEKEEKTTSSDD